MLKLTLDHATSSCELSIKINQDRQFRLNELMKRLAVVKMKLIIASVLHGYLCDMALLFFVYLFFNNSHEKHKRTSYEHQKCEQ